MLDFVTLKPEEKRLYFEQTAFSMKVAPIVIEKDFWVCYTLFKLFSLPKIGETLIFKGGTTLSKVYKVIQRFSEDIDISIDRKSLGGEKNDPSEMKIGTKEKQRRLAKLKEMCQKKINEEIHPLLNTAIANDIVNNGKDWSLETDDSDPDGQTLIFKYPSALISNKNGYIQPVVKIEMGARSDHWPSENQAVIPYVAEKYPQSFRNPSSNVKVLSAKRTFWEKATLLHAEYNRPDDKPLPSRLSRHYYDMAMLIKAEIINIESSPDIDLLEKVTEHKKIFFQSSWAKYDEAKKGTLHISPNPERISELENDYKKMQEMFFVQAPSLTDILATLSLWENELNQTEKHEEDVY